eukprot:jgi/Botrbrau1/23295/Bobra.0102s0036.1
MPSQKRKSSSGEPKSLSPWDNYQEAKIVEANLLQALKLLKGNGLGNHDTDMRTRVIDMVSMSLDLVQSHLPDEGQGRPASRRRSTTQTPMVDVTMEGLCPTTMHVGAPEMNVLSCSNRHDLSMWHKQIFLSRAPTLSPQHREPLWAVQPQYAGISACLVYCNGTLTEAFTLVAGKRAGDITERCRFLSNVPDIIPHALTSTQVFGTFMIRKHDYQTYLDICMKAHPRMSIQAFIHILLGTTGLPAHKALNDCLAFCPTAAVWEQDMATMLLSECSMQQWLKEQGFTTYLEHKTYASFAEAVEQGGNIMASRSGTEFEIAGVVIVANSLELQHQLGSSKGVFWQYPPFQEIGHLNAITWEQLQDGPLEPVGVLEPPLQLGGLTYTFMHFEGLSHLRQLQLKIPDCVVVQRQVGMEPKIVKAVPDLRVGTELDWENVSFCPVCSSKLEDCRQPGLAEMHCSNMQCPSEPGRLIRHFANICIKGSSPATIDLLQERGLVRDVGDLFQISQADLENQAGLSKRTAKHLSDAVAAAKALPLDILLQGMGIRHMNQAAASQLSAHFRSLSSMEHASVEELEEVRGVEHDLALSIYEWFRMPSTKQLIRALSLAGLESLRKKTPRRSSGQQRNRRSRGTANQENVPENKQMADRLDDTNKVEDKRIAVCGKLSWSRKSKEAFRAIVQAAGGRFCPSVTSKTDVMVVGTSPERAKMEIADKHGVICVEEETFFKEWLNLMDLD